MTAQIIRFCDYDQPRGKYSRPAKPCKVVYFDQKAARKLPSDHMRAAAEAYFAAQCDLVDSAMNMATVLVESPAAAQRLLYDTLFGPMEDSNG
jgi:hypothetical protein